MGEKKKVTHCQEDTAQEIAHIFFFQLKWEIGQCQMGVCAQKEVLQLLKQSQFNVVDAEHLNVEQEEKFSNLFP